MPLTHACKRIRKLVDDFDEGFTGSVIDHFDITLENPERL